MAYRLSLSVPEQLKSGQTVNFDIGVPKNFQAPYNVDINVGNGLSVGHTLGNLNGTITGIAGDHVKKTKLRVSVTDKAGREARLTKTLDLIPTSKSAGFASSDDGPFAGRNGFWKYFREDHGPTVEMCLAKAKEDGKSAYLNDPKHGQYVVLSTSVDRWHDSNNTFYSLGHYSLSRTNDFQNYHRPCNTGDSDGGKFESVEASYYSTSVSQALSFMEFLCRNPHWMLHDTGFSFNDARQSWNCRPKEGVEGPVPSGPWSEP